LGILAPQLAGLPAEPGDLGWQSFGRTDLS
jgi:hypothetical protein